MSASTSNLSSSAYPPTRFILQSIFYFMLAGALSIVLNATQANLGRLGAGQFYSSLFSHGEIMIFGFASLAVMGIISHFVPKELGRPLHSQIMADAAFWLMNLAMLGILVSGFLGFSSGWGASLPLPLFPAGAYAAWVSWIYLLSQLAVGLSLILFSLAVILTVLRPGNGGQASFTAAVGLSKQTPYSIVVVAAVVAALGQLLASMGLIANLFMGFAILLQPAAKLDWLLAKNFFWFFGNFIPFFILLPVLGLTSSYVSQSAGKVVSKRVFRAFPLFLILGLLGFPSRLLLETTQPLGLSLLGEAATLLLLIPSAIVFFSLMASLWQSKVKWSISTKFFVAGLIGWFIGLNLMLIQSIPGLNLYLNNTLVASSQTHLILLAGSAMMTFAAIYLIFPEVFGKLYSVTLSEIHLWATLIGGLGFSLILGIFGFRGSASSLTVREQAFAFGSEIGVFLALITGFGQILFTYNIFRTAYARKIVSPP